MVKAKDIGSAVKDFGKKNVEDKTGIDFSNAEVDESTFKLQCLFDGDSGKTLANFVKEYKDSMKDAEQQIAEQEKKLKDDVKKAKVKIDDTTLEENGATVANVLDADGNKDKSGKELTKEVDAAIKANETISELAKKSDEDAASLDKIKIDPKIEKLSDEEFEKKAEEADKKEQPSDSSKKDSDGKKADTVEDGQSLDNLRKKLRANIQKKISKDFKNSVQAGIFSAKDFLSVLKENGFTGTFAEKKISDGYFAAVRIDYYDDEAEEVVQEKDSSGYKVSVITGKEKNTGIKKITDYVEKTMKAVLGADNISGKIYKYRKCWNGDNSDGNFDQIYVFAQYVGKGLAESLQINEGIEAGFNEEILNGFREWAKSQSGHVSDSSATSFIRNKYGKEALAKKLGKGVQSNARRMLLGQFANQLRVGKGRHQ